MLHVGELIIYAAHGVCRIDDICDRTIMGTTRTYYVLHPLEEPGLTISIPTDFDSIMALQLMEKDEAERVVRSFGQPGIEWIENNNQRLHKYNGIIGTGDRQNISDVVNTLRKKKDAVEKEGRKFGQADLKMLTSVQNILFSEIAISLDTTVEDVEDRVARLIETQN